MSEGRLYKADIDGDGDGFVLRLCKRPEVVGRGGTFEAAYEELVGSITLALGDGEPRVMFRGIVPSPAAERAWMSDRWVAAVARRECVLEWNTPELFTGGVCGLCGRPRGARTSAPLVARPGSSGDYCGAWFLWDDRAATHWMRNG